MPRMQMDNAKKSDGIPTIASTPQPTISEPDDASERPRSSRPPTPPAPPTPPVSGRYLDSAAPLIPGRQLRAEETEADAQSDTSSQDKPLKLTAFGPRDEAGRDPKVPRPPTERPKRIAAWWWWEIASAFLSVICVILILVLLARINSMSLQDWQLPIQPNSIIAILTTVAKSSLTVPIAACLSQLKWQHFEKREDCLHSLQLFDDASRGPWGAATLLLSLRTRKLLAWALALITLVALGIDPAAQQILRFPQRPAVLGNVTAQMGIAPGYVSKAAGSPEERNPLPPTTDLYNLQSSIINGMSGQTSQLHFDCPDPAKSCTWGPVTTLGICSTFHNVTHQVSPNCTGNTDTGMNCTYDYPGRISAFEPPINMTYMQQVSEDVFYSSALFRSVSTSVYQDDFVTLSAVRVTNYTMGRSTPPRTEFLRSRWFWCAQTFPSVTSSNGKITYDNASSVEELSAVSRNEILDKRIPVLVNYTRTLVANSTGTKYAITETTVQYLFRHLQALLTTDVIDSYLGRNDLDPRQDLDLGYFLFASDLGKVTKNIAATLSNQIRSADSGDNLNATTARGQALSTETYIYVQWPWLIVPLAATALGAILLLLSIIVTWNRPVLKESVFPYFLFGMDEQLQKRLSASHPQTGEEMALAAKHVRARLLRNDNDNPTFIG